MKTLAKFMLLVLLALPILPTKNTGKEIDENLSVKVIEVDEYITIYESVIGTVYHPVEAQTDNTPLLTADHTKLNLNTLNSDRIVALSRNLIYHNDSVRKWNGVIPFGSKIYVESKYPELNGEWKVHDTMNKRYTNNIDFIQNHNDPTSIYGKWRDLKIKVKVKKRKLFINDILFSESIVDNSGMNLKGYI